jgi:hypothetical protein
MKRIVHSRGGYLARLNWSGGLDIGGGVAHAVHPGWPGRAMRE